MVLTLARAEAAKEARKQRKQLERLLLHTVAKRDCAAAERILLQHPQVIKAHASHHMGVLSLAAAQGDVPMCKMLLEYGADVSQRDAVGATPLIHAAAQGATAAVQLLIDSKQGANAGRQWLLQQATGGGETAVMAAAKGGHLDTLQVLCTAGADVSVRNQKGSTALLLACKHNRPAVVQHLVDQCHCSCSTADTHGTTPLMTAAGAAARDVVALLLLNRQLWGLQLDAVDAAGNNAVAYAARGGDAQILGMLADVGLLLQAKWPAIMSDGSSFGHSSGSSSGSKKLPGQLAVSLTNGGSSSSCNACEAGCGVESAAMMPQTSQLAAAAAAKERLLHATTGMPATKENELHSTAAELSMVAVCSTAHAAEPSIQQQQPAAASQQTLPGLAASAGASMLHGAGSDNCTSNMQEQKPFSLNEECLDGGDALLYMAAEAGSIAVVGLLLQLGIGSRCLVAADECNPVFAAVKQGHADTVRYLVQQGASLEPRDSRARTPLAWAAATGRDDMVVLLVQLGADLLAQDMKGRVARQLVYIHNRRSTADLLTRMARSKLMLTDGECGDMGLSETSEQQP